MAFGTLTCGPTTRSIGSIYLYRQDTGNDGAVDSYLPTVVDKLEEGVCLKEELGDDEVGPGVYLLLEMAQVLGIGRAFWVASRVTCMQVERGKYNFEGKAMLCEAQFSTIK